MWPVAFHFQIKNNKVYTVLFSIHLICLVIQLSLKGLFIAVFISLIQCVKTRSIVMRRMEYFIASCVCLFSNGFIVNKKMVSLNIFINWGSINKYHLETADFFTLRNLMNSKPGGPNQRHSFFSTWDRSVPKICMSVKMLSHPKVAHPPGWDNIFYNVTSCQAFKLWRHGVAKSMTLQ